MVLLKQIFAVGILCEYVNDFDLNSIKVMVSMSGHKPFVTYDERRMIFRGLDVNIIENFGRKIHKRIELIKTDDDLQNLFASADGMNRFFNQTNHT